MCCVAAFPRPREAVSRAAESVDAPAFASLRGPYSITDLASTYSPQNALSLCDACCVLRVACCVLRVACCVLRVACCVLRV
jgi:hypothetical protein